MRIMRRQRRMSPKPGDQLGGGYQLVERLGAGGMGEVWLATEVRLGRKVALKVLPSDLTRDPLRVERFEQEARAASALNHPNVCTIHAVGETGDSQHYIAMEYVEGETLRQRLATGRLSIREAIEIAIQVAAALNAAHAAGIVHRDIKPENVMLRPDGFVKVLDFGLAKLAPLGREFAGADTTRTVVRTDAGTVVGTVTYMSPEQARGQQVDARTDVWALGCVLYELIAGRSPFQAASSSDVLAAILDRDPAPLARFEPEVPAELQRIVNKALRKQRTQRYQTMQDLLLDLQAVRDDVAIAQRSSSEGHLQHLAADAAGAPGTQARPAPSSAEYLVKEVSRHKLLFASIGMLTLATAAGFVWWTTFVRRVVPPVDSRPEPKLTRLTANPNDLPLGSARISPDGRYLAYSDPTGIKLRFIDTGETQRLPDTQGMNVYGWSSDSTKVRASACQTGTCRAWDIFLVGGSRQRSAATWPEGDDVIASSDGTRLLRLTWPEGERDWGGTLTLDLMDGTPARPLVSSVSAANWSADGNRILFAKQSSSALESIPLQGGPPVIVFTADKQHEIAELVELADRRLILLLLRRPVASAMYGPEVSLWEARTDNTGAAMGSPRQLTHWQQDVEGVSASADGARLTYRSTVHQWDVYVAGFDSRAGLTTTPKRLTLDDRLDVPMSWTPDSTAVLFHSTRNGTSDIFKQRIDNEVAEPLATGPRDQTTPRVTSDGQWVLFDELRGLNSIGVMRVPLSGGTPQELCIVRSGVPFCSAHGGCVLVQGLDSGFIVSSLDPLRGKGAELARAPSGTSAINLLPDGQAVSYGVADTVPRNRVRIVSFKGEPVRDIVVQGATDLTSIDWLSSGEGFLSSDVTPTETRLLFISADGTSRMVWSPRQMTAEWAVPSPDGKHVAVFVSARQSDVWMVTTQNTERPSVP
jgi:eukaryotic-like serine/threonine-protein kinase